MSVNELQVMRYTCYEDIEAPIDCRANDGRNAGAEMQARQEDKKRTRRRGGGGVARVAVEVYQISAASSNAAGSRDALSFDGDLNGLGLNELGGSRYVPGLLCS